MWENDQYTLYFQKNAFYDHELAVLSEGSFPDALPVSFLREEDAVCAMYDSSGYAPLASYRIERTDDALYLMEKTLLILHAATEYLLDPARMLISTDTLFYNRQTGELRLAFVPLADSGSCDLKRSLILFLAQLKQDLCDPYSEYTDELARDLYYNNLNTREMLIRTGLLRRKLDSQTSGAS